MKYTYSDDEDTFNSDSTNKRSTRNTRTHTPVEQGPVTTSSGRQIRAPTRLNAATGSSAPGSVKEDTPDFDKESSVGPTGRPRRSAAVNHGTNGWAGTSTRSRRNTSDSDEDESEAEFGDDEEDADALAPEDSEEEDEFDEAEAMVEDDLDDQPQSLVVKLSVPSPKLRDILELSTQAGNILASPISLQRDMKVDTHEAPVVEMQDAPALGISNIEPGLTSEGVAGQNLDTPERNINCADRQSAAPATIHVTPLAFRGSPEKPHAQLVPRPIDIGTQE